MTHPNAPRRDAPRAACELIADQVWARVIVSCDDGRPLIATIPVTLGYGMRRVARLAAARWPHVGYTAALRAIASAVEAA